MKPVTMFVTDWCPYCNQTYPWLEELKQEDPRFANIEVRIVDEEREPEISKQYDYYYVPTFYVDGVKVHEGVPSKEIVRNVFEKAL